MFRKFILIIIACFALSLGAIACEQQTEQPAETPPAPGTEQTPPPAEQPVTPPEEQPGTTPPAEQPGQPAQPGGSS